MPTGWQTGSAPSRAGVGLRAAHHTAWLERKPSVGWLEAHAENYFAAGGVLPDILERLSASYPLSLHGVGLGLAGREPLDSSHLQRLQQLVARHQPAVVSEHLCWSAHGGVHFNDLLPFPFERGTLEHVISRVQQLQDALGRTVLVEHLASYVSFGESTLAETDFLTELVQRSGCGLLLDLNNLYVNSLNHGIDVDAFLAALPPLAIGEIHLAAHRAAHFGEQSIYVDSHDGPIAAEVWQLYRRALERFGYRPTLIEWDADLPTLELLVAEAQAADRIAADCVPAT